MSDAPELGREVATTELTATSAAERNALTHLAADARMLSNNTHPNLVRIVEARWLAANRLSIARARVRGSTLRQALDAVGPMPEQRVVEVLNDVGGVLDWAVRSNVVHRHVASDCVCFQKGSGRVMVSFGLPANFDEKGGRAADDTGFLFERCADGATLARLAYEMLTAHQAADASVESLQAVRPDVSPPMLAAIEAGLSCSTGGPSLGARQFLAMLPGGRATAVDVTPHARTAAVAAAIPAARGVAATAAPVAAAPAAAVVPRAAAAPVTPPVTPPPSMYDAPAYAAPTRRRGRGLLIASMLALVLLMGSTFVLIQRDRSGTDDTRIAVTDDRESAGDIDVAEVDPLPADPEGLTTDGGSTSGGTNAEAPPTGAATTSPSSVPSSPSSLPSNRTQPLPEALPPAQPRVAPSAPTGRSDQPASPRVAGRPVAVQPRPQPPTPAPAARVAPTVVAGGGCASATMADQRACLSESIAASDRELTSVYQALLAAVRDRHGEAAVENVRVQQRAWLVTRDRACREPAATEGALWARERAACLGRQSDARALQLARALASVRSGGE